VLRKIAALPPNEREKPLAEELERFVPIAQVDELCSAILEALDIAEFTETPAPAYRVKRIEVLLRRIFNASKRLFPNVPALLRAVRGYAHDWYCHDASYRARSAIIAMGIQEDATVAPPSPSSPVTKEPPRIDPSVFDRAGARERISALWLQAAEALRLQGKILHTQEKFLWRANLSAKCPACKGKGGFFFDVKMRLRCFHSQCPAYTYTGGLPLSNYLNFHQDLKAACALYTIATTRPKGRRWPRYRGPRSFDRDCRHIAEDWLRRTAESGFPIGAAFLGHILPSLPDQTSWATSATHIEATRHPTAPPTHIEALQIPRLVITSVTPEERWVLARYLLVAQRAFRSLVHRVAGKLRLRETSCAIKGRAGSVRVRGGLGGDLRRISLEALMSPGAGAFRGIVGLAASFARASTVTKETIVALADSLRSRCWWHGSKTPKPQRRIQ
jgi:hypothetical protein